MKGRVASTAFMAVVVTGWLVCSPTASLQLARPTQQEGLNPVAGGAAPLIQYQGRLASSSGNIVADGVYAMTFRLYDVEAGGQFLWVEPSKAVLVRGGAFSTVLGEPTPLPRHLFDGRALWLGIQVQTDPEAAPRIRVLPTAYALGLAPGAMISDTSSAAVLQVNNRGGGPALQVRGQTTVEGNLSVSGALSGGRHTHSGADITSGTVAEPRIDAALARDSEVMTLVKAGDGAGSGVDADLLDGLQASAFSAAGHAHSGADITSGTVAEPRIDAALARDSEVMTVVKAGDGAGSGVDADLLDGVDSSAFAAAAHHHLGQTWTGANTPLEIQGSFAGGAPLNLSNSGTSNSDGLQIRSAGDDGVQINAASYGVYVISATYHGALINNVGQTGVTINSAGGTGVYVGSAGGNGVYALNNSTADTVYAYNTSSGKGLSSYSQAGVAGWFGTYGAWDVLVVEEKVTQNPDAWDARFRVTRPGYVYADQSFNGGGADFAELLPAEAGLSPGDVLVVGSDGALQRSNAPNATNVAGVYSTRPGFVGGSSDDSGVSPSAQPAPADAQPKPAAIGQDGKSADLAGASAGSGGAIAGSVAANAAGGPLAKTADGAPDPLAATYRATGRLPLAVLGVVPTKVCAENGAINPGDLLTTSSLPGHAMKALPVTVGGMAIYQPGTLIGKALEPMSGETGVIQVLVTLQ